MNEISVFSSFQNFKNIGGNLLGASVWETSSYTKRTSGGDVNKVVSEQLPMSIWDAPVKKLLP
jgi:hypothetical protein